ncbi:MAG: threonine--tRNA ligase [Dehalococcoidia bacterium]
MQHMKQEQKDTVKLETMRHSAAHIMAEAVQSLFSDVKFGIGPATEDGFYYDFELPRNLTPDDLSSIEEKMREIVDSDVVFTRDEVTKEEAREIFASQPYKLELIEDMDEETISVYKQGSFTDLCRGPHVNSTGEIGAFKLLSIAGAYWRGDEHRPMLQRIYGTAFETEKELSEYLQMLEEAAKRDHRKLGRELDLFSVHDEAGPGLIFWHPRGATIRRLIEDFWRNEHLKRGYDIVYSPHVAKVDLWKQSGHLEYYKESMYSPMDLEGQEYVVKPMNCPFHILMYKSRLRSYRELPLRWGELGTVYRWERSGTLHGLSRVRGFTQDDAHIFCRPDQLEDEIVSVVKLAQFMLESFDFQEYAIMLATRPDKYTGTLEDWETATSTLQRALNYLGLEYEEDPGEGVFYGPKIDISLRDALGRTWQGPTIQVDFNLPERFGVSYIGEDGQEHMAVMVHRTVLGSMERFFACLIEHYGGAFPVWLAPVQVRVIPITDRHIDYAQQIADNLRQDSIRVEIDQRNERMNLKIREAQLAKIPYMLVIGDSEVESSTVTARLRNGENLKSLSLEDFKDRVKTSVQSKAGL